MLKTVISGLTSIALVICLCSVAAASKSGKETLADRVKSSVAKLGTGPSARIDLKLTDKTKLKGYVSAVNDSQFVVVEDKTGSEVVVTYPQVKQVKGNNLSTSVKIAIGIGIVILVILAVIKGANGNG